MGDVVNPAEFAATIAQTTTEARQLAESLMTDTCVVRYQTGRTAINTTTNVEAPVMATRFTSACRVRQIVTTNADEEVGGRREALQETRIDLPVSSPQVFTDDEIEITAVGAVSDPRLVGRTFIVGAPMNQTYSTATRLRVEEAP
jgi:hypothetical protein